MSAICGLQRPFAEVFQWPSSPAETSMLGIVSDLIASAPQFLDKGVEILGDGLIPAGSNRCVSVQKIHDAVEV